jgi:hypothetical protein
MVLGFLVGWKNGVGDMAGELKMVEAIQFSLVVELGF